MRSLVSHVSALSSSVRIGHSLTEVALAVAVSLSAHAAVATWLRPPATEAVQLNAFQRVEVSLLAAPAPRPKPERPRSAPVVPSRTVTAPAATESPVVEEPPPQQAETGADKDEPLVEAKFNVDTLHNPRPAYPLAARRRGQQGRVLLSVLVRNDGSCAKVMVKKTSGYGLLDTSALETVREWRFVPARRGNTSIDSWVEVPVTFKLENAV